VSGHEPWDRVVAEAALCDRIERAYQFQGHSGRAVSDSVWHSCLLDNVPAGTGAAWRAVVPPGPFGFAVQAFGSRGMHSGR